MILLVPEHLSDGPGLFHYLFPHHLGTVVLLDQGFSHFFPLILVLRILQAKGQVVGLIRIRTVEDQLVQIPAGMADLYEELADHHRNIC